MLKLNFVESFKRVLFSSLVLSQVCSASSIKQLDVGDLLRSSELVFEGQVLSKVSRWNEAKTTIFTDLVFRVDDVVVGSYTKPQLTLSFMGGEVDGLVLKVEGLMIPSVNEKGIYFIESLSKSLVNPLVGWSQGHFLLEKDASGEMGVLTQDKKSVFGVDISMMKSQPLSTGTAIGVKAVNKTKNSSLKAMSPIDFKDQLKTVLNQLQKRK